MIAIVSGVVYARKGTRLIVLTPSGIGFDVTVADGTPGNVGEAIELACWTFHNENDHEDVILGFKDVEERDLAKLIYTVDGVGHVLAHRLVTTLGVGSAADAIAAGDIRALTHVRGLGRKTAEKVIQTLKDHETIAAITGVAAAPSALQEAMQVLATMSQPGEERNKLTAFATVLSKAHPELSAAELVRQSVIGCTK
jgi:Holliday junction DNA helicase RuvA